jgi:hypothetical protein
MCFIDDNKYFIQHSFQNGMKGLSDDERIRHFSTLRLEVRQRLKDSHSRCVSNFKFYKDAIEILFNYDADYLILNIFYEATSVNVFNVLNHAGNLKHPVLKDPTTISAHYYLYITTILKNKGTYNSQDELSFLKTNFIKVVPSINLHDWNSENENRNPIISKYSKWIIDNCDDEANVDKVLWSFLLFVKIWNSYDFFHTAFNRKVIVFYSAIISEYDKISDPKTTINFYKFYYKARNICNSLFVKIKYIPLLDTKDSEYYRPGYLIQRELFLDKLRQAEQLSVISGNKSILSIFRLLNVSDGVFFISRAKIALLKKIDDLELPNDEELLKIKNLQLKGSGDDLRTYLFEKLYLFEFI